jgi:trehalose/maltose hydrolase-like predicted phosphorylase
VSADVVYAIWQYYEQTGDFSVFVDGAAEVIGECARFFYSYAHYKKDKSRYELLDVVGPDEYHERVHNNAFTNRMVKFALDTAVTVLKLLKERDAACYRRLDQRLDLSRELDAWRDMADALYIPQPNRDRIIEQFDGYFELEDVLLDDVKSRVLEPAEYWGGGHGIAATTQVLKQADVVLMLNLFSGDYSVEEVKANWEFYEPRTEHGSSLSACAYAMVAAQIGKPDWAYQYFMKTATIDLTGKSKQYLGPLYIGGTHPAANGGAWLSAVFGFAGLTADEDGVHVNPRLPSHWKGMEFSVVRHGVTHRIRITQDDVIVEREMT